MTKLYQYSKYLFPLGLTILISGIVAVTITNNSSPEYLILIVLGIIIIVFWLTLFIRHNQILSKRSTKVTGNALVATLSILIILALVNFLSLRYSYRLDLTENQLFTLAPQSQKIVKELPKSLKVWYFTREPNAEDKKLLKNYSRLGNNFKFEFIDPQINIGLAEKFQVQYNDSIYLEYGDKIQLVQTLGRGETLTEATLTNAIEKIQQDISLSAYFLQGHGEPALDNSEGGLGEAVNRLTEKNYTVQTLNLATTSKIPDNANLIIIAGPERSLLPGEISALKQYLDKGGKLLILLNPNTNSGLESLLKEWGIELDDRLVIDASGSGNLLGFGAATPIITNYGDHPITQDFRNGISIYPLSRRIITNNVEGISQSPILITNDNTWAESDIESQELTFDPKTDVQGPLNIGVAASKNSPSESRLVVIGSATFATNGWLRQQLNGDVFLNSVNWLVNKDKSILSISPKEPTNRRINLSLMQATIIAWTALLIMPLLGLTAAGLIWWKSR